MRKYKVKLKGILENDYYLQANSKEEAEKYALIMFEQGWNQIKQLKDYYVIDSEKINF